MSDWKKIGDIVNFKRGYDLPSQMRVEGKYPILSSSGITGYHSEYKAEGEGLVTGRYGTLGEMYYVTGRYWPHNTALYVTDFKNNYPKYVYFLLKSLSSLSKSDKSTVPGINRNDLHEIKVPYVRRECQIPIANILYNLERKIELNNRINAELEAMAKTLYNYWFVQFNFPDVDGKPYKANGGSMVWNDELKREIPEDWGVGNIGNIASVKSGFAFKSEWWQMTGVPVIKITNIENGYVSLSSCSFVSNEKASLAKNFKALPGDIVIAMTGATIGKFGIVPDLGRSILVNQRVGLFDLGKKPLAKIAYLINTLSQPYVRDSIFSIASGCAQPNISSSDINNIIALKTPQYIINKYNLIFSSYYKKITVNVTENQRLSSLRDWLLPMLMNGQVQVGESVAVMQALAVEKNEQLAIADSKKGFAKQVLGGKIVSLFQNDPHFSNIKFQKLQYLAEHIAEVDLNWNYYYQAAGPYDNVYMHSIYDRFKASQWFVKQDYRFVVLEKQFQIDGYYQGFFRPVLNRLDHLFTLLADATDVQAEIIATLYAVWNNRIILKQPITDEALIEDFYSWSDRKLLYTQEQLIESLGWMRIHAIIPTGFGREIKKAKGKK